MGKTAKRVILGITIPAAIAGAVVGGLLIYRNVSAKPVPVYPLEQLAMTDYGNDMAATSGTVSSEGLQKVFISATQTVSSVDVQEGQEVKKGDVLLSYDTTLTDIEVERARVKVGRLNLELNQAQKELDELNNAQPHTTTIIEPGYTVEYKPSETPKLLQGSGTSEDPYIYLFDEYDGITGSLLNTLISKAQEKSGGESPDTPESVELEPDMPDSGDDGGDTPDPGEEDDVYQNGESQDDPAADTDYSDESEGTEEPDFTEYDEGGVYVVIINRENNALNAQVTAKHGIRIDVSDGAVSGISFFEPYLPENIEQYEEQPQPHEEESGSEYTQEELVQMRARKAQEITEIKRNIALAQNEYDRKKLEVDEKVVRATVDGVVTKVRTPQEASMENSAVVELSAGGSYYVTGTISEFDLENVHIGDSVSVEAYGMSDGEGGNYEGEIVEISDKPATGEDAFSYFSYGEGNDNVTYYPFKVRLSADADLRDDSYIEIYYQPGEEADGGVYIMNAFVKRDGADSYVYARGADGRLEKRSVKQGRSLWGSYTQIKSGLKADDMLAFPYGKDVKEGVATKVSSIEEAYSDMSSY